MYEHIQGLVMSLDGVLFNSYPLLKQTYDTILESHSIEANDYFYELYLDAGPHAMERAFYHFYQYAPRHEQMRTTYVNALEALDLNPVALDILKRARDRGLILGFTSGLSRKEARVLQSKLPPWLQQVPIVYYNEVIEGKPERSTCIKLARAMKIDSHDIVSIDASLNGVLGAYLADMKPIYVELFALRTLRAQKYSLRQLETLEEVVSVLQL